MVAGEILVDEQSLAGFSYKTVPSEICQQILLAYSETPSVEQAYHSGFPVSPATFARVIRAAAEQGMIEMQPQGGLPRQLMRAKEVVNRFPHERGYSREQQAATAGVSLATVYRAERAIE